ncbi:thioredoxin [Volvox carteri f. nagariensis]|uniref:Thioredoxin n=1 Tax=Volvox carteri f. nagariensis TaxID=3068 RepID=D8TKV8_VOLCA|nr:thioredoxin [Volvox carteri f. nagariensis]EFJ51762.1 thioredoxin [Volvox carteri f. nagariensis]|eukprot:XP_002947172.1 thioredoxin [Volvox carteri f. nagariensis]
MLCQLARSARCGQNFVHIYSATATGRGARYATAGAADKVVELQSDKDFAEKLKAAADSGSLLICDFTAKWCGPCRMIAPIFSQLSNKFNDVSFVKIDIDNPGVSATVNDHSITGVPTFVYYKGGRRVESFSGARPDLLEELIKKHTK